MAHARAVVLRVVYTQNAHTLRITMIHRQPEDAQTLYAELLALLAALDGARGWSHLAGTFATKVLRGLAAAEKRWPEANPGAQMVRAALAR
jgi:hypothetical protein